MEKGGNEFLSLFDYLGKAAGGELENKSATEALGSPPRCHARADRGAEGLREAGFSGSALRGDAAECAG